MNTLHQLINQLNNNHYFYDEKNNLPINISEYEKEYKVEVDIRPFKKENIKLFYENNHIYIEAKSEQQDEQQQYLYQEFKNPCYLKRKIFLENINFEDAKAQDKNSILQITIPKRENKKVEIKIN